jgi:hypothetical protein
MQLISENSIKMYMQFQEDGHLTALDFSSFVFDFNLLYDAIAIDSLEDYDEYDFNIGFWKRNGRRTIPEHRLYFERIRHESPLEFVTILTVAVLSSGFIWTLVQVIDKVSNWDLNREKLALEVSKLRTDDELRKLEATNLKLNNQALAQENRTRQLLNERLMREHPLTLKHPDLQKPVEQLIHRIERNPLRPSQISIYQNEPNKDATSKNAS